MLHSRSLMLKITGLVFVSLVVLVSPGCSEAPTSISTTTAPTWGGLPNQRPSCVKGIHLTAWCAGSKKSRAKIEDLLATTEINTIVIGVKEDTGEVFIPGIKVDGKEVYTNAIPDLREYLKYLKDRGVYTIARVVVFHDNFIAKKKPEWAIHASPPLPRAKEKGLRADVWVDRRGSSWADPYNEHVWNYNIDVAVRAAQLGFQGIQFDYIRFPSDGETKKCVYSKPHSKTTAPQALTEFLRRAHEKLKPMGVELSIDVFGLVGSTGDDMGIGQRLKDLIKNVDVISPMMYPSHYAKGEFGIAEPNKSPYDTIHRSISDTLRVIKGTNVELRPYLQDFSLGVKYTPKMVREQIQAANDLGVNEWLLWNPLCRYSGAACLSNEETDEVWIEKKSGG